jgi:hypothetical protein
VESTGATLADLRKFALFSLTDDAFFGFSLLCCEDRGRREFFLEANC